jgi:hypothetical protein
MPWKLTRDYNRQCLLVQTFCTNSVAANRTNFFIIKIVPDWRFFAFLFCWHFSYRTCAFCKGHSDWLQLPLAALHINRHRVTSKIRLAMPKVKMSRADRNPWLAKMPGTDFSQNWGSSWNYQKEQIMIIKFISLKIISWSLMEVVVVVIVW